MAKKVKLIANISEKVMDEIWEIHAVERVSRSQVVERLLAEQLKEVKTKREGEARG